MSFTPERADGGTSSLAQQAKTMLESEAGNEGIRKPLLTAIRRAHKVVSSDLYIIDSLRKAGVTPDYKTIFGKEIDEKLAALIFLTKQKLLDIENSQEESQDTEDARKDLVTYVEILYRLSAVEALMAFYDFAAEQHDSKQPKLWQNVSVRCLHLMALMPDCREKVIAFLVDRLLAVQTLQTLAISPVQQIADPLSELLQDYTNGQSKTDQLPKFTPPPYIDLLRDEYEGEDFDGEGTGISSFLTAKDRIYKALEQGDVESVIPWVAEGSPAAMRTAMQYAGNVLTPDQCIDLLEKALHTPELTPVRRAAIVMQLGKLNRSTHIRKGMARINAILARFTMTKDEAQTDLANIALNELASVEAVNELETVVEKAPLDQVAIDALMTLKDIRRLPLSTLFMKNRPELLPIFEKARAELREIEYLTEMARTGMTDEIVELYLSQLKQAHAIPELKELSEGEETINVMAKKMLAEIQAVPQV